MDSHPPPLVGVHLVSKEKNMNSTTTHTNDENFLVYHSKRNRSSPNAKSNRQKQRTLSDYWLGTPKTANQFELLAESIDDENEEVSGEPAPTPKPPPIYISMVKDINLELLNEIAPNDFEVNILTRCYSKVPVPGL